MRRVVVTGIGLITSLGIGKQKTWERVLNGECGIDKITAFDTTEQSIHIAGEVKDFNPEDYIEKKEIKKLARFSQFAVAASKLALEDSKFVIDESNAERTGVIVGSGIGGLEIIETEVGKLLEKGSRRVSPFYIPGAIVNMAAGNVSIYLGAKGPNTSVVTACAAGTNSIGDAYEIIKLGKADTMIAGGAEATITPSGIAGFANLKALSTIEDPKKASRPFTADRAGFVMGEGAGILILEELEQAKARGAKIYAEIVGYGSTGDAYHMTSPSEGGEGAVRAMKMALDEAEADITEVDYINAHGTSTPANDKNETAAIKEAFGGKENCPPVSSTKGQIGHCLGAAGAIEAIMAIKALTEGIIPPTINVENQDEDCDLDIVPNVARKADLNIVMSNNFGFGGTNGSVIFKKYIK